MLVFYLSKISGIFLPRSFPNLSLKRVNSVPSYHRMKRWPKHRANTPEGGNRKLGQVIRVTGTYNIHTWVDKSQQRIEACQPDTNQAVHYRRPLQVTLLMKWSGPADGAERKSMGDAGQRHAFVIDTSRATGRPIRRVREELRRGLDWTSPISVSQGGDGTVNYGRFVRER